MPSPNKLLPKLSQRKQLINLVLSATPNRKQESSLRRFRCGETGGQDRTMEEACYSNSTRQESWGNFTRELRKQRSSDSYSDTTTLKKIATRCTQKPKPLACECKTGTGDVFHFINNCPLLATPREEMFNTIFAGFESLNVEPHLRVTDTHTLLGLNPFLPTDMQTIIAKSLGHFIRISNKSI